MEEGYNQTEKSIYLIEQSEINSELAIEKSRTAKLRARVAELARQNEILREDFEATFGEAVQ
jgi:bifunctional ADP-heptose synthase (sugar kinase/adenylyltransferase)